MIANTYNRLPISFTHGEGVWLYDEQGNKYLDGVSGIAVNTLGHSHPKLVNAIIEQSSKLIHTSNLYRIESQEILATKLAEFAQMQEVFFCNSGAEANEAAIKISRLWGNIKKYQKPQIVVLENAFHGRTMATLSATGNKKIQKGFEPLVDGFIRIPINDINALHNVFDSNSEISAVLIEPIQGEGGINTISQEFLQELQNLCDQHETLLMLDEVQCGIARTGKWFAFLHYQIQPDVLTIAKGLGGGVPIGACLTSKRAAGLLEPGSHGTTYGGNPLVCSAALAVINTIIDEDLFSNVTETSNILVEQLINKLIPIAGDQQKINIRGQGLMLGVEWNEPIIDLPKIALQEYLLTNVVSQKIIRILPPLILSKENAIDLVDRLCNSINRLIG